MVVRVRNTEEIAPQAIQECNKELIISHDL